MITVRVNKGGIKYFVNNIVGDPKEDLGLVEQQRKRQELKEFCGQLFIFFS